MSTTTRIILAVAVLTANFFTISSAMIVTCGSYVNLQHVSSQFRLYSTDMTWGAGSGQQVVTATKQAEKGSMWRVKEGHGETPCLTGAPVKCNTLVRLEHPTGKNLHSHEYASPVSSSFEVSGFGDGGSGDNLDSFVVECGDDWWNIGSPVKFKHAVLNGYLRTSTSVKFTDRNCPRCPIVGHQEVALGRKGQKATSDDNWKATEGVMLHSHDYFEDNAEILKKSSGGHDDL